MDDLAVGELVYRLSLLLLYPTLVLLGLGFLKTMWHLGESVLDAWTLRSHRKPATIRQLRDVGLDERGSMESSLTTIAANCRQHPQLRRFVTLLLDELHRKPRDTLAARIDHLVSQIEASLARDVNRMRVPVRLGPLLGLVGTLIPLGPGLMALNEGDLGRLSSQLVVAFSTTVVGLLIGGISYAIAMARAHTADLVTSDVELASGLVIALLELDSPGGSEGRARRLESEEVSA
jgi:biopolymer transport protein ExbB/TolQ